MLKSFQNQQLFSFLHFFLTGSLLAQQYNVPELLYFKFKNNVGLTTPNYASSPVGLNPASISGASFSPADSLIPACLARVHPVLMVLHRVEL